MFILKLYLGITVRTVNPNKEDLPPLIRVSIGSAIILQLLEGKIAAEPTTAYLMTYISGKCAANCAFCPQARASRSKTEMLARVSWPTFSTNRVLKAIENAYAYQKIKRVCIQALNSSNVNVQLVSLAKAIKLQSSVPLSVSCQPLAREDLRQLEEAGVNRIGIALDAATEKLFNETKGAGVAGPYTWESQFKKLGDALEVFGKGNVSTHLIVGLGETEKDAVSLIQKCVNMGVLPALFAFTPVRGTLLENRSPPLIESYRRIQLARYLIVTGKACFENMHFDRFGRLTDYGVANDLLVSAVETGEPFLTNGCPHCNRPFYNEKPSGPIYNYPRALSSAEVEEIKTQLSLKC
ncbi:MAG: radical SAM protein [Candidatus Bathyarchaeota archaeon]|nr:radical SAM protein [Candidatus Bathyarchaeota archaeon]